MVQDNLLKNLLTRDLASATVRDMAKQEQPVYIGSGYCLVQVSRETHNKLRKRAADERCKLKELTERLLVEALKRKATT